MWPLCSRDIQMVYRYLRRKKWEIALATLTILFLYLWTDGFGTSSIPLELRSYGNPADVCSRPCFGPFCPPCYTDKPSQVKVIDLVDRLQLKQALHGDSPVNETANQNATEQVCRRPNFDLNHDSVRHVFFHMNKLNCSREALFFIENNIFRLNGTVLGKRKLESCVYLGVERVSDDFTTYTEPLTKDTPPFDLILKHDFVRIKCFLKTENGAGNSKDEDNVAADIEQSNKKQMRKLLHVTTSARHTEVKEGQDVPEFESQTTKVKHLKTTQHVLNLNNSVNNTETNSYNFRSKDVSNTLSYTFQNHRNDHTNKSSKNVQYVRNPRHKQINSKSNGHKRKTNKIEGKISRRKLLSEDNNYGDDNYIEDENVTAYRMDESNDYNYDPFYTQYDETADFDQFLVQVQAKSDVFHRISGISPKTDFESRPNVLMFGLDSMSHLSYQRKLPKLYKYLQEKLGAVIMQGYNIVGDATTAALLPMLTGKTETELPEARRNRYDAEQLDSFPFIWKQFKNKGYVTMLAEDEPSIGVFNLRLNGFRNEPTDHYMRPFWQAIWESKLRKVSPRFCTGNIPHHMFLLQYTKDFFDKYSNVSKFAFVFGSELTHWDNNPGEYMDQDFVDFLEYFRQKGYLDNTVVIIYGDHGARYSRVRNTVQGKMEERLPLMTLTFPSSFRRKHSKLHENLAENSARLATPFDVHETLDHILNLNKPRATKPKQRGISLLTPVPADRTCTSAHIDMHWCTCLKQLDLDVSDGHVQKSVNALITFLNNLTLPVRNQCSQLKFKALQHAYLLVPNEKVLMFQRSKDDDNRVANFSSNVNFDHLHFQITIETMPNKGLYETTVQVNMTAGSYTVMESQVSRLDRYGSQPSCIQDKYPDLRKYCYCKDTGNQ